MEATSKMQRPATGDGQGPAIQYGEPYVPEHPVNRPPEGFPPQADSYTYIAQSRGPFLGVSTTDVLRNFYKPGMQIRRFWPLSS